MSGKHNKAGIEGREDSSNLFTNANLIRQMAVALYSMKMRKDSENSWYYLPERKIQFVANER